MLRLSFLIPFVAILFGHSMHATAQIDSATAEQVVRKSGLWQQLGSIAPQVQSGFLSTVTVTGFNTSPKEVERLKLVIDTAFAPERLRASAVASISQAMSPGEMPALLKWYDSPLGKEITKLEEAASVADRDPNAAIQEGRAVLSKLPPARLALLRRLMDVTRSVEGVTNMTINLILAVQQGAALARPGGPTFSWREMRAEMESQRPKMQQGYQGIVLALFANTYRTLSDTGLGKYIELVSTPAGIKFMDVGIRAVDKSLTEAAADFGKGIPTPKISLSPIIEIDCQLYRYALSV